MRKFISILFVLSSFLFANAQVSKSVTASAGNLYTLLSKVEKVQVTHIIIDGTIDASDFKTLRDSLPNLQSLDLKNAKIQSYTGLQGTEVNILKTYSENSIPQYAFYNVDLMIPNSTLQHIILPSSITEIGHEAFYRCVTLDTLFVSSLVYKIESYAFSQSSAYIVVDSSNSKYGSSQGVLFNKQMNKLIHCPISLENSYAIPSFVDTVEFYAFSHCSKLTELQLPSSLKLLRIGAFANCTQLHSITVWSQIPSVVHNAVFENVDTVLCKLYVPKGTLLMYQTAFGWNTFDTIIEFPTGTNDMLQILLSQDTITAGEEITCTVINSNNSDNYNWYKDSLQTQILGSGIQLQYKVKYGHNELYLFRNNESTYSKIDVYGICDSQVVVEKIIELPTVTGDVSLSVKGDVNWSSANQSYFGSSYVLQIKDFDSTYIVQANTFNESCNGESWKYTIGLGTTAVVPNDRNTIDTIINVPYGNECKVTFERNPTIQLRNWRVASESLKGAIDTIINYSYSTSQSPSIFDVYTFEAKKIGVDTIIWIADLGNTTITKRFIFHILDVDTEYYCPQIQYTKKSFFICDEAQEIEINPLLQFVNVNNVNNVSPVTIEYPLNQSLLGIGRHEVAMYVTYSNGCYVVLQDTITIAQGHTPSVPIVQNYMYESVEDQILEVTIDNGSFAIWDSPVAITYNQFKNSSHSKVQLHKSNGDYVYSVSAQDPFSKCISEPAQLLLRIITPLLPSISGTVSFQNELVDSGYVQLYKKVGSQYQIEEVTQIHNGIFTFKNLQKTTYILRAVPQNQFETALPSYYFSTSNWKDAFAINLQGKVEGVDIKLIPYSGTIQGQGTIQGSVMEESNKSLVFDSFYKSFVALQIPVFVMQNNSIVAYGLTDSKGLYSIQNIPDGTYQIYVDLPSVATRQYTVTIKSGTTIDANFILLDGEVVLDLYEFNDSQSIQIYPNPTTEKVYISTSFDIEKIELFNLQGQLLMVKYATNELNVSALQPGMYNLVVTSPEGVFNQQIIKK